MKKCSPEKVDHWAPTQKLELPYHELSCSRLERQNYFFLFFLLKIGIFINLEANLLKKSQKKNAKNRKSFTEYQAPK